MARFLVVDDDQITVHGMTRLLEEDGLHVTPFTAGADAVRALEQESFDAVLTDRGGPGAQGRCHHRSRYGEAPLTKLRRK